MAFATPGGMRGFDRKIDDAALRTGKLADFAASGVTPCETLAEALAGAHTVLSLVTADQALAAARAAARLIGRGALWIDLNSVSPQTKQGAAALIERAGGRYVDVAIMAPVLPLRRAVPLLIAGPHAEAGRAAFVSLGFNDVRVLPGPVGTAAAVKLIRSVMVKGIEALTAECVLAADAAGVREAVLASLGPEWSTRAEYNLERMRTHGLRRAAEMEEATTTLEALGTGSAMTRATVRWQRAMASMAAEAAPPQERAA